MPQKPVSKHHNPLPRGTPQLEDWSTTLQTLKSTCPNGGIPVGVVIEQQLKKYLDANYVLVTASRQNAMHLAAQVLGWQPGDHVIMPSLAPLRTAQALVRQGAQIIFADVDESSWNIDPVDVAARIGPQTRTVVPVHFGGQSCDMLLLANITRRFGLTLLEDITAAVHVSYANVRLGVRGESGYVDVPRAVQSPNQPIGVFFTSKPAIARQAQALLPRGRKNDLASPLASAVLPAQFANVLSTMFQQELAHSTSERRKRRTLWWHYQSRFTELAQAGTLLLPWIDIQTESNWDFYALRVADPAWHAALLTFLQRRGILARGYTPLHLLPFAREHGYGTPGTLPVTERICNSLVQLPIGAGLTLDAQEFIIQSVLEFFNS